MNNIRLLPRETAEALEKLCDQHERFGHWRGMARLDKWDLMRRKVVIGDKDKETGANR